MAIAKSNRFAARIARSSDRRGAPRNRQRSRGRKEAARVPTEPLFEHCLLAVGLRLRMIYGTAVTAQLALRQQAGGQDKEIADCLREGVCNPLSDEIGRFDELIRRFDTKVFLAKRSPTFNEWLNAVLAAAPPAEGTKRVK